MFFDRDLGWVLKLAYFDIPESARGYLFPQSVKIHYFCSGPISVDPICPQPNASAKAAAFLEGVASARGASTLFSGYPSDAR